MKISKGCVQNVGGRWQLKFTYELNGKKHYPTHTTEYAATGRNAKKNYERALMELDVWRATYLNDLCTQLSKKIEKTSKWLGAKKALRVPFSDYCKNFILGNNVSRVTGKPLEPTTIRTYITILNKQINPYIGDKEVWQVTQKDIEALIFALTQKGMSASTIKKTFNLINSTFVYAEIHDGLETNPCKNVVKPKRAKPRDNPLTIEEAKELQAKLKAMNPSAVTLLARLILACGVREGEACAIKVSDVDLKRGVLYIRASIARSSARTVGGERGRSYLKEPKTEAGVRTIPLNKELKTIIKDACRLLEYKCREEGYAYNSELFLLGKPDGTWITPSTLSRQWSVMAKTLDLKGLLGKYVTLHDLRHTFTTYALALGAPVKDVQVILGHSSASTTLNIYASSDPVRRAAIMEKISREK